MLARTWQLPAKRYTFELRHCTCVHRQYRKGLRYIYRTFMPNELSSASQLAMIAFQSQRAAGKHYAKSSKPELQPRPGLRPIP